MIAPRQRLRQLGGDDAAPADRGVTDNPDMHVMFLWALRPAPLREPMSILEQVMANHRLVHNNALSKRHAGEGSELGVSAFDELREPWRV